MDSELPQTHTESPSFTLGIWHGRVNHLPKTSIRTASLKKLSALGIVLSIKLLSNVILSQNQSPFLCRFAILLHQSIVCAKKQTKATILSHFFILSFIFQATMGLSFPFVPFILSREWSSVVTAFVHQSGKEIQVCRL